MSQIFSRLPILCLLAPLLLPLPLLAQPEGTAKTYEVVLDGERFELPGGTEHKVTLKDGRTLRVELGEPRIQPYSTGTFAFSYDTGYSLKDDFAEEERQIVLMHGSGFAVILTDHGATSPLALKSTLAGLIKGLEESARRGVAEDLRRAKAKPVTFTHAKGTRQVIDYLDEDGDRMVYQVHVLESKKRLLSVIVLHQEEDREESEALSQVVLDSVRGLP